jgi:hypothetical protein
MLTQMQKQLLQNAAQQQQLVAVLAIAFVMLDVDTVQYIVQHMQHALAPADMHIAQQMLQEMQFEVAALNTAQVSSAVH